MFTKQKKQMEICDSKIFSNFCYERTNTSVATTRFRPWCPTQRWWKTTTMSMGMTMMVPVSSGDDLTTCLYDAELIWIREKERERGKETREGEWYLDWLPDLLFCLGNLGTLQCRIGWSASAGSVSCWAQLRGCWTARALAPLSVPSRQRSTHDGSASELWWRASCVPRMASMERKESSSTGGNECLVFTNRARGGGEADISRYEPKCQAVYPFGDGLNCTWANMEMRKRRKLPDSRSDRWNEDKNRSDKLPQAFAWGFIEKSIIRERKKCSSFKRQKCQKDPDPIIRVFRN